jgi:hypothetical protein
MDGSQEGLRILDPLPGHRDECARLGAQLGRVLAHERDRELGIAGHGGI